MSTDKITINIGPHHIRCWDKLCHLHWSWCHNWFGCRWEGYLFCWQLHCNCYVLCHQQLEMNSIKEIIRLRVRWMYGKRLQQMGYFWQYIVKRIETWPYLPQGTPYLHYQIFVMISLLQKARISWKWCCTYGQI